MIDRKTFWLMKKLSKFISSIENIEINRRSNAIILYIFLNQSSKFLRSCNCCTSCIAINNYVIFVCDLIKSWNELRAFQRRKNNRNRFIIAIILRLERSCRCQICVKSSIEMFAKMFAKVFRSTLRNLYNCFASCISINNHIWFLLI